MQRKANQDSKREREQKKESARAKTMPGSDARCKLQPQQTEKSRTMPRHDVATQLRAVDVAGTDGNTDKLTTSLPPPPATEINQ